MSGPPASGSSGALSSQAGVISGGGGGGGGGGSGLGAGALPLGPASSVLSSASVLGGGGGDGCKLHYFHLSDLNLPVQIKIKHIQGALHELAERMLFEQQGYKCAQCGGARQDTIPMHTEPELYVSVSIWSRGAPIGLPANTAYRPVEQPYAALAAAQAASAQAAAASSPASPTGSASNSTSASGLAAFGATQICNVRWNSWLQFPVPYRDLDHASRFGITVWCVAHGTAVHTEERNAPEALARESSGSSAQDNHVGDAAPEPLPEHRCTCSAGGGFSPRLGVHSRLFSVGSCSIPIFNKRGRLKMGRRKLFLDSGVEGDPSLLADPSDVPSVNPRLAQSQEQLGKLEKLLRAYESSDPVKVSWLDKLAARRIQKMQQAIEAETLSAAVAAGGASGAGGRRRGGVMSLAVEFPNFKHPVVFHQRTSEALLRPIVSELDRPRGRLFVLHDPEVSKTNPIEAAYHKMARSTKGLRSRDLKPSRKERDELAAIISSPNKKLTPEAKALLWRFRFSLIDDQRAVTKFLRSVAWEDVADSKEALELLQLWGPIPVADALELLSSAFPHEGVREYAVRQLHKADHEELSNYLLQLVQALRYEAGVPSVLSDFLIARACQSMSLANFFHWYLAVEVHDEKKGAMYALVLKGFMEQLSRQDEAQGTRWVDMLEQQGRLIQQLIALSAAAAVNNTRVDRRIVKMRQLLADGEFKALRSFQQPIRISVRPEVQVTGILGEESTMFKSALAPMMLCFTTPPASLTNPASPSSAAAGSRNEKFRVIFKCGDDLRQDQLLLQLITLMDALLKKVKLDLQLTPYRVLATGPGHGFVEFVEQSHTITSILAKYDSDIRKFFEQHNPKPQVLAKVLDTFVKSCAGYCVITYILGVGDRHLDNVMLTNSGHLFHIDFSFLFGRDPKPYPPPMKFSKEMVEAMGGAHSTQYQDFRRYCCLAFNILRQHANLILNLLSLMGDANIPDLSLDVEKNLLKTQEKFRLDLSDTEADGFILSLIDQSVSALFPQVMDRIHNWAVYWK